MRLTTSILTLTLSLFLFGCMSSSLSKSKITKTPTIDNGTMLILESKDLEAGAHHTRHAEIFGKYVDGYNYRILEGIDRAQASALDGGGYFIGVKANPPESPMGYDLSLFERPVLDAPRKTSYCSGATYTAFIEGLNLIYTDGTNELSEDRYESLRMQELDGGRREDGIKFWGKWNDDGYGNHFALVQYSGMGEEIDPQQARPGDFMNISWKKKGGHSVVFLGWYKEPDSGEKKLLYWSSQKGTNGMGDQLVSLERINEVKVVRLTNPDNLFTFDPEQPYTRKIKGNVINWQD